MTGKELLEGARVRLAALLDEDMTPLAKWLSDPTLQRMVNPGVIVPVSPQDLLAPDSWISADRKNPNSYVFAIRTRDDHQFIGITALADRHPQARYAEYGINIAHPDYQNQGYGTEVTELMLRYGFMELNLNRIWLSVFGYNTRAIKLYEKVGFVHEGAEREMVYRDGQYYDLVKMGMLRREWEARQQKS
jgi:RimJ/RimL family protein N-acetyltransferase